MTEFYPRAVDRAIRKVAELRALCGRLPHVPTHEIQDLAEFDSFPSGRAAACSLASPRAGFRAAWAARDDATIVALADKLPAERLRADATILTYVENAARRLAM